MTTIHAINSHLVVEAPSKELEQEIQQLKVITAVHEELIVELMLTNQAMMQAIRVLVKPVVTPEPVPTPSKDFMTKLFKTLKGGEVI